MRKLLIIPIIALALIPLAYGIEIIVDQEYLDGLNTSTMTWATLLCDSNGTIEVFGNSVYTRYECIDVEKLGEGEYLFYTGDYYTVQDLKLLLTAWNYPNVCGDYPHLCEPTQGCNEFMCFECEDCDSHEWTEMFYWNQATKQALEQVNATIQRIREHQTGYYGGEMGGWNGTIF